jgi:uncharacterized protein (TIGR01777 family)
MKIVLLGGTGVIGRGLTASLAADGHEVVVVSRSPERVQGLPTGARAVGWDARTAEGWGAEVDGADALVNFAGASVKGEGFLPSRWTAKRKRLIRESRVNAGLALVEAVRGAQRKPGVVIQASAVGYYGPRGEEEMSEDGSMGDDFLAQVCAEWEASSQAVEAMGVRRCVVRTGLVLTNAGGAFPLLKLPFYFFAGGPFGSGRQYYPWIHYADEIRALRFLIENKDAEGIFNLTAPNPVPNKEFARALGKALRRPSWLPAPAFAMKLALGEVSTVVLDGQRAIPAALQGAGFTFEYPHLDGALTELVRT